MTGSGAFWDGHYGQREQIWSGRANPVLVAIAAGLPPGTALDVGCGEGGDALWLAARGWEVTAVDVSAVALARTAARAAAEGRSDRVRTERHDLAETFPAGRFDLVSAQYLHSPLDFPRDAVLRRAADAVAPGGRLLVVGHAAGPSWAPPEHRAVHFPTPEETLAALALDPEAWRVERCEVGTRAATGPDGQAGTLLDSVLLAARGR